MLKFIAYLFLYLTVNLSSAEQPDPPCLRCICQASSNCDTINLRCPVGSGYDSYCGPYQISRYYWEDGNSIGYDFETCTNLKACAERVVINYMRKYARDCNDDGLIDCRDYAAIHRMGADRCDDPSLYQSEYWQVFEKTECCSSTGNERRGASGSGRVIPPRRGQTKPVGPNHRSSSPPVYYMPKTNSYKPPTMSGRRGQGSSNRRRYKPVNTYIESGFFDYFPIIDDRTPVRPPFETNYPSDRRVDSDLNRPHIVDQPTIYISSTLRPTYPSVASRVPITEIVTEVRTHAVRPSRPRSPPQPSATPSVVPTTISDNFDINGRRRRVNPTQPPARPTVRTVQPTVRTVQPTVRTAQPSVRTAQPSVRTAQPTVRTAQPTVRTAQPTVRTAQPSVRTAQPSVRAAQPTVRTAQPTARPTTRPTVRTIPPQAIRPVTQPPPSVVYEPTYGFHELETARPTLSPRTTSSSNRGLNSRRSPNNNRQPTNPPRQPRPVPVTTEGPVNDEPFVASSLSPNYPSERPVSPIYNENEGETFPPNRSFRSDYDTEDESSTSDEPIGPINPIPPHLTNISISVSEQCLSCLCQSTESCQNKGVCTNPKGPCGPYQVTLEQWVIAGKPKGNFQKCASSLDCSQGIVRKYLTKNAIDCNLDSDVNCVDFALIHKYGLQNCKGVSEDLFKSGYWLNFENCYGFDRR